MQLTAPLCFPILRSDNLFLPATRALWRGSRSYASLVATVTVTFTEHPHLLACVKV